MRELSSTFRQAVYEGNRNYKCSATIQTEEDSFDFLLVDNTKIMYGGIEFTDAVSSILHLGRKLFHFHGYLSLVFWFLFFIFPSSSSIQARLYCLT